MTIEKALRWIVLGGIFLLPVLPLFVANTLFFPFITGKNFAFRIIVEIIFGAWLALALVFPRYRPRRSWVLAAFGLLVAVMALADAMGVNPMRSFWSNFERMEGWVTLAHLLVYLVVAFSVLNTDKLWKYWWQWSLVISGLASAYGLLQLAGRLTIDQGGGRLDATFGNATYLAVYMLFHVFIAAMYWSAEWIEKGRGRRLSGSLLYGSIIALDVVVLFYTETRGAILGLLGGLVLAAIIFIILSPTSRLKRPVLIAVAALVVLSGGLWLIRDSNFVQSIRPLSRVASISLTDTTVSARFINWGMAWQGVKEKPLLGWGQENYGIVFDKYYDPKMYAQEPWFDRVHEIFLDWLIAGGVPGLAAYLLLYVAALLALWRPGRSGGAAFSIIERSILSGLFAGYLFYLATTFDNITSYILFVSLLAFIATRFANRHDSLPIISAHHLSLSALPVLAGLAIIGVWGLAWEVNASALAQNRTLIQAISQQPTLETNLNYFEKAIQYGALGAQEARERFAQGTISIIGSSAVPVDTKQKFFQAAATAMIEQAKAVPLEARFPVFLGILYDSGGAYANAAPVLQRAHELSPKKQSILFELGINAFARGDNAAALSYFKQAFDLAPEYKDARNLYAAAAIRVGQESLADQLLAPLIAEGDTPDQRVIGAYVQRNEYRKVALLWDAHIAKDPQDAQARFTLAAVYFAGGDRVHAVATLRQAGIDIPAIKAQADSLIEKIQSGTATLQ